MNDTMAFPYTFINNGGTIESGRFMTVTAIDSNSLFQMNGGTINTPTANYSTPEMLLGFGYSFWHIGGTFEITQDSVIDNSFVDSNVAVFGGRTNWGGGSPAPILKFTGDAPVLTVTGEVWFRIAGDRSDADPTRPPQLDVSELSVTPGQWTTVMDIGGPISYGGDAYYLRLGEWKIPYPRHTVLDRPRRSHYYGAPSWCWCGPSI